MSPLLRKNTLFDKLSLQSLWLKHRLSEPQQWTLFQSHFDLFLSPSSYQITISWVCSAFLYMSQSIMGCMQCTCVEASAFVMFLCLLIQDFPSVYVYKWKLRYVLSPFHILESLSISWSTSEEFSPSGPLCRPTWHRILLRPSETQQVNTHNMQQGCEHRGIVGNEV